MVNMEKTTEQIILETAQKHFVQKGFAATRMQEIADEAGINKAMLHYYFRSKDKLYSEIVEKTLGVILPKLAAAISDEGAFWEKVEKIVDTYLATILDNPGMPFFIMSELSQKKERFIIEINKQAAHFPIFESFIQQIYIEMKEGRIREMPPIHLMLNLMGMIIFPFMARPMLHTILGIPEDVFQHLMSERKEVIMDFLRNALKI
jgi:AcrR family transcriptional regulator